MNPDPHNQTAFLLLSMMDDLGDDSVPLGVYSVPGLARPPPGWVGLSSQVTSPSRPYHLIRGPIRKERNDAI